MSDLPPGLDEFGYRLRAASADQLERQAAAAGRGSRGWKRLVAPVGLTVLTAAGGASAVHLIDGGSGPAIRAEPGDGAGLAAPRDPAVVPATAVPDPDGGPPWVVRVYTSASGEECAQVGRLRGGVFGQLQDRRFRPLPYDAPGVCGPASRRRSLVAVERRTDPDRTLVFGLGAARASFFLERGRERRRVTPAGLGAFVAVFKGAMPARIVLREPGAEPQRLG